MAKSSKGGEFEREVAKRLGLWWAGDDSLFWRTSQSGGRATTRAKKGKETRNAHGDLCATCPSAQPFCDLFTCELKNGYRGASLADLLDFPKGKPLYARWLEKLKDSAKKAGTLSWLLIVRRHGKVPVVILDSPVYTWLRMLSASNWGVYTSLTFVDSHGSIFVAMTLDNFLTLPPDAVRQMVTEKKACPNSDSTPKRPPV